MAPHRRLAWLAATLTVALTPMALAQNLVSNGSFDIPPGDTSGWLTFSPMTFQFSNLDRSGRPTSGSVLVTFNGAAAGQGGGLLQCITPVTAGSAYDFGAFARLPAGQSNTGHADLTVFWFSDSACTTAITGTPSPQFPTAPDVWTFASSVAQVAPPGTLSARIGLGVAKNEAGGTLSYLFDDVYFGPSGSVGTVAVPTLDSRHVLSLCVLLGAVAVYLLRRGASGV